MLLLLVIHVSPHANQHEPQLMLNAARQLLHHASQLMLYAPQQILHRCLMLLLLVMHLLYPCQLAHDAPRVSASNPAASLLLVLLAAA